MVLQARGFNERRLDKDQTFDYWTFFDLVGPKKHFMQLEELKS